MRSLPRTPGVYQMKDKDGRILYIGKAMSLRDRVSSYFNRSPKHGENIEFMLSKLEDFDVLLTGTESEAFVLEASLVKQFKPPYNILLKDDKSYPYIKITMAEAYPRLFVTRKITEDGSRYFGPYTSVSSMRRALRFIANLFNLRTCSLDLDGEKFIDKPCLDYHLKLCSGPCADLISRDEYAELARQAIDFFSGREEDVVRQLETRMYESSNSQRYESAARLRDVLFAVKKTQDRQVLWGETGDFFDAIGYAFSENHATVLVVPVRAGRMLGETEYNLENELGEEPAEILDSFIQQYYANSQHIQPIILLPEEIPSAEFAAKWLSDLYGRKVRIHVPKRGRKSKLVQMAMANARERLRTRLLGMEDEFVLSPGILRIQEIFGLDFIPRRIEGFDISHLRGRETVGSMVVFTDGKPDKQAYRSFTVKIKARGDDLAALREVLRRRLLRFLSDDKWYFPDSLLLIDGGRTQLDAVLHVIRSLKLEFPAGLRHDGSIENAEDHNGSEDGDEYDTDSSKAKMLASEEKNIEDHPFDRIAVAALAKREETLFHYDRYGNLLEHRLEPGDPGLMLLVKVRDESHRRAQRHHHARREKSSKATSLERIPGLGEKRIHMLLSKYKSIKRIREADLEELAALPGMNEAVAVTLKKHLVEKEGALAREWRLKDEVKELRRKPRLVKQIAESDVGKDNDAGSDIES